jgi:hypothetical protein
MSSGPYINCTTVAPTEEIRVVAMFVLETLEINRVVLESAQIPVAEA